MVLTTLPPPHGAVSTVMSLIGRPAASVTVPEMVAYRCRWKSAVAASPAETVSASWSPKLFWSS